MKFVALWAVLFALKIVLAARLPLFVDEAFYAWESRRLAWAYSDLPGLTAWLIALGRGVGGEHPLAVRIFFLLIGAGIPWLVVRIATRWFGAQAGWRAGLLALLMPLSGLLGMMAMPDVPIVFAALLCLDGMAQLRERIDAAGWCTLVAGLAIGALSHYRFAGVVAAGLCGLLLDRRARALFADRRFWLALLLGACAWLPLLLWNFDHAGAGLRFQLLDRNPWSFHGDGLLWLLIQCVVVTPLLFVFLSQALVKLPDAWRRDPDGPWGLLLGIGSVSVFGYFLLGFFADHERVSFHWPLSGWLVLIIAMVGLDLPQTRGWRIATVAIAGLALSATVFWLALATDAGARLQLADTKLYPQDFSGAQEIADAVRALDMPSGSRLVADNFELAAQLAFALHRSDVLVLDHPHNHKHGRAPQLQLWGLQWTPAMRASDAPTWLIVEDTGLPLRQRLTSYHRTCEQIGALPVVRVLNVDRGQKRFLVYRLPPVSANGHCVAPALAWIDTPTPKQRVAADFIISGWAFKDGAGLASVDITIDGRTIAEANYGRAEPRVAQYWKISSDPQQPRVGFDARIDAHDLSPGKHWLGLVLHGRDGSVEPWPEQAITISK
ncbi:MAG TPA: glycosyltransferase family 39 protein [Arenimonas sp.]|uniref:ArnT family glycosyltransferase n=1 Tax=Arenimonas sp. TaxID=1872635 RepID=UPI002B975F24|nr:glycosyltransferase family 39 protein [Arenimonas sp.]HMB56027.1 glycosyltransferase family 39 protein [Arenimonas sp.]